MKSFASSNNLPYANIIRIHTPYILVVILRHARSRNFVLGGFQLLSFRTLCGLGFLADYVMQLLCLLGRSLSTTKVFPYISSIDSLSAETLDSFPSLLRSGWNVLLVDLLVDTCSKLRKGSLHKGALVISRSEEDSI